MSDAPNDTTTKNHPDPGKQLDLVVIGAGIAGLCAALTATTAGLRVAVVDAHPPGGRARTTEHDGFLHNLGPHALYRDGELAHFLQSHGLAVDGQSPPTATMALVRDGDVTMLDMNPVGIARSRLLRPRDRARLLALFASLARLDPAAMVGRSVDEWLGEYPTPVRQFIDMLIRLGTYTDSPASFDAGAAVAQLHLARRGGVIYLHRGWGALVATLVDAVTAGGGVVHSKCVAQSIEPNASTILVRTDRDLLSTSTVIIAAGGPDVATRLGGVAPIGVDNLTAPITASVLDLALSTPLTVFAQGLDEPLYLSAHAPVADLAPAGRGLVSVLRYHAPGTDAGAPDSRRDELRRFAHLAGIAERSVLAERYLHRVVVCHGAPTARGGGLVGRPGVSALGRAGVFVAGDWVGESGLLADASAASGTAAARAAVQYCAGMLA